MNRTQSLTDGKIGLTLLGHMLVDEQGTGSRHQHDFDELIYVLKGPLVCNTDADSCRLLTGQLVLIPKDTPHTVTAAGPASFLYVGFHTNLTDLSGMYMKGLDGSEYTALPPLTAALDHVADGVFAQTTTFSECVPRVLSVLLPALLALGTPKKEADGKAMLMYRIKQSVQKNRHKPMRVEELALGLYHTPQYVGNAFAVANGMTLKEFELADKMQQAPVLLREEKGSVANTATRLGYDSPQYFSKCFKAYYGVSPSAFVKENRKG